MPVYVLTETPAGYGVFESSDGKLLKRKDLPTTLQKSEKILDLLKLKTFTKYESAAIALEESAALAKGQIPPMLSALLEDMNKEAKVSIAVADLKLASAIGHVPQIDIKAVAGSNLGYLYRSIREHLTSLMPGITYEDYDKMSLGLGHSISRHKLKFSADKIDSMVCHTVKVLDDVDRETNVFAMRLREWYNWHWPELFKLINDNIVYARVILTVGSRAACADADLSDVLPEEIETQVRESAQRSMGTELDDGDLENCQLMARQVIQFSEMRQDLTAYLESRMQAIAPNLTALVGFLVGARLIAHVGTVTSLAKSAASTIQVFGAEKALFRALKTKHATPKYGLIYHSSLVGQATGKNKGKMARMLAAKAALGVRVDAMSDDRKSSGEYEERAKMGMSLRLKLESRLRFLEGRARLPDGVGIGPDGQVLGPGQLTLRETRRYNTDADGVPHGADAAAKSEAKPGKSKKMIEVVESKDIEMKDVDGDDDEEAETTNGQHNGHVTGSATLGSASVGTDEETSRHRHATGAPKKTRNKERKVQKQEAAADYSKTATAPAPAAATAPAPSGPERLSVAEYERRAALAGISAKKFQRKYERGDVDLKPDGTLTVVSKKELKKLRKAATAPEASGESSTKRKRGDDAEGEAGEDQTRKKNKKEKKDKKSKKADV